MKTISFFIIGASLFFCATAVQASVTDQNQDGTQLAATATSSITLTATPGLTNLAAQWADAYVKEHPGTQIRINEQSENGALPQPDEIILTDALSLQEGDSTAWKMAVGHNAVVAVISAHHPQAAILIERGVTANDFKLLLSNSEKQNWKEITGAENATIHIYFEENEAVIKSLSRFTGVESSAMKSSQFITIDALKSAFQKDQLALGFARLSDLVDRQTGELPAGLKLLPLDKNMNGHIDSFESIYANVEQFTRGVWIGKYPRALSGNIFAVATQKPEDDSSVAFLQWMVVNGQSILSKNGFAALSSGEEKTSLASLSIPVIEAPETATAPSRAWMYLLGGLILISVSAYILARNRKSVPLSLSSDESEAITPLHERNVQAPKGLWYDKSHIWAFMETNGMVRVGVDDFMQHVTGKLTRVKMLEPGDKVKKGDLLMTLVREGKKLDLYSPVTGIIKKHNAAVLADASIVNNSPYYEGWVYLIEPNNWAREMEFLLLAETYKSWLREEFARLKNFFSTALRQDNLAYAHVILQDGGELADNMLADLSPEVWEDFQTRFIDTTI